MRINIVVQGRRWRRQVVALGAVIAALATAVFVNAARSPADSASPNLETASVATLDQLLDSGSITSVALTNAYLARIRSLNSHGPALNAVRAINPDALAEARAADTILRSHAAHGPLVGIPVIVKDNVDVTGMPTTAGSVALVDSRPSVDAPLVTSLRKAGAVILGKGNLTEFANFLTNGMPSGYSSLGGQVLNPYDASQTPSGSSSGPAAAAAAGFAPLTVGTETSGSILSPSNQNMLAGIKPTVGRISRYGVIPITADQDTPGPMARTVTDAAILLGV
ncbi:MAG TPA: amidase family protein, partial [Jatrophihabitantaceae bacterium]|nr:amidase family protein [Jatrophihabitantaceae bacterium]